MDASSAAKAIQDRHFVNPDWKIMTGGSVCSRCSRLHPCDDVEDAGVVLARLSEAIHQLEAIDQPNDRVVAALAALKGEA